MSDTGGGHRAAAEATINALNQVAPPQSLQIEMVDFFLEVAPPPFNRIAATYRPMITYIPRVWGAAFRVGRPRRSRQLITGFQTAIAGGRLRRLFLDRRPDMVVSVHPLAMGWACRILRQSAPGVPFVAIVTDLAAVHPLWFSPCVDWCCVPNEQARLDALAEGLDPERLAVTGVPIDPRFSTAPEPAEAATVKAEYGAAAGKPLVLLVGGGEGMGDLEGQAEAVAQAGIDLTLMVVAGRNEGLRRRLEARRWPIPVIVTGFVRDLPRRMSASDAILTKAGPGTLSEALAVGLPILITGFVPGTEDGNIALVVEAGAARVTRDGSSIQAALEALFDRGGPTDLHATMAAASRRIARPGAALEVASQLLELLKG